MRLVREFITVISLASATFILYWALWCEAYSLLILTGIVTDFKTTLTKGRWDLVAMSVFLFLIFILLIPVRLKKDWKSHGVYTAFIVSLFAEMFGFPLSIYFISSILGLPVLEVDFTSYILHIGMPIGSFILFIGASLIILGWREVYKAGNKLATGSVYKYMRHPQYLGIILVTLGWLIYWPTIPVLILFPVITLMYYRQSKEEESALIETFGEQYIRWAEKTPMMIPRL
jgi:protein-S-isoprenylcysteine O-methyltransferase Ste14